MDIQLEIKNYLDNHDQIVLPGIGAFLAEYSKPYLDSNGAIVPPLRSIRYNPFLSEDIDLNFLKYLQRKNTNESLLPQNAYFDFLDQMSCSLDKYKQFQLRNIGILIKENNSTTLKFIPLAATPYKQGVENKEDLSFQRNINFGKTITNEPKLTVEQPIDTTDYEVEKENKWFKYLIFALPILLLASALIYSVFIKPTQQKAVKEQKLPLEQTSEVTTVDTVFVDSVEISAKPSLPVEEKQEELKREHIVRIGIYKNNEDAEKIAVYLAENGYPARVRPYGTLYKVYLVALSEQQAQEYVQNVSEIINDTPVYEK